MCVVVFTVGKVDGGSVYPIGKDNGAKLFKDKGGIDCVGDRWILAEDQSEISLAS